MARIETKKKEKLSNIGSWIIIGILSAVVITGIVLTIPNSLIFTNYEKVAKIIPIL